MQRRVLTVVLIATVVTGAACSSSSKSSSSSGATTTTAAGGLDAAVAAVAQAEQGTNRPVDATPRPAVKGKHIVVISSGQASISSQVPSDAAVAAAKAAGWQVDLYDAKLNPAAYPTLVRQAVAAGADGIVLDAIDCQTAQQPLAEAKAKGIVVVPIYAFDCNDAHAGNGPVGYYSSQINFGAKANADIDAFAESFGVDQANYIIADSKNTAKIIDIQDPEFTVLYYTLTGFDNTIKASGGSQVVSTLNITSSDILAPAKLVSKIQAEVLRHPEATWIKSPYTYATLLGIVPALAATPNIHLKVMGSEGFQPELDLVRAGKVAAVNIISSEWVGWAAVDTMNSLFRKETPVDSGIGWTLTDATHNLPASGPFNPPIDFKAAYKKAWGVG
ncbi:MAG TPA: substrate-binding domain-containing protein [Nocardioides sp.]|nr:substrate-binding domain-containing protein [Nocardioides sp.]